MPAGVYSALIGSGRTEIARAIFGADDYDRGEILLDGQPVKLDSPRAAIRLGIGLVPEDRKQQALFLILAIRENIALSILDRMSRFGFVRLGEERLCLLQCGSPGIEERERITSLARSVGCGTLEFCELRGALVCVSLRPSEASTEVLRGLIVFENLAQAFNLLGEAFELNQSCPEPLVLTVGFC